MPLGATSDFRPWDQARWLKVALRQAVRGLRERRRYASIAGGNRQTWNSRKPCNLNRRFYQTNDLPGGSAADYPGQRTKITYPDAKTVTYTYEVDGRMKTVTDWLSRQTVYTYDNAGRLTNGTNQHPNVWTDYGYDNADRLTGVFNRKTGPIDISTFQYVPDAVGNRKQMTVNSVDVHDYQYDNVYRLTQADYPGPDVDTYTYDGNGNRMTKNGAAYTYNAADQMLTAGGLTYSYDENGNQRFRGSDTYVYDYENRLTSSTISGLTSTSTYNGDGLRMSHTIGTAATTNYTWDVATGLPVVLQDGTNTYVYGLDLISATDNGGTQTYFLYDGLGSTTELINGTTSATVMSYRYDVFGAIRSQDPPGPNSNPWLFTGEQHDSDSSLYYLRARYYDPATGRFLGRDPLPSGNLYAYVGNNPVNLVDPSGLCHQRFRKSRFCLLVHLISAVRNKEGGFRASLFVPTPTLTPTPTPHPTPAFEGCKIRWVGQDLPDPLCAPEGIFYEGLEQLDPEQSADCAEEVLAEFLEGFGIGVLKQHSSSDPPRWLELGEDSSSGYEIGKSCNFD